MKRRMMLLNSKARLLQSFLTRAQLRHRWKMLTVSLISRANVAVTAIQRLARSYISKLRVCRIRDNICAGLIHGIQQLSYRHTMDHFNKIPNPNVYKLSNNGEECLGNISLASIIHGDSAIDVMRCLGLLDTPSGCLDLSKCSS